MERFFGKLASLCLLVTIVGCAAYDSAPARIAAYQRQENDARVRLDWENQKHGELSTEEASLQLRQRALSASLADNQAALNKVQAKLRSSRAATARDRAQAQELNSRLASLQSTAANIEARSSESAGSAPPASREKELDHLEREKHQIEHDIQSLYHALSTTD